MTQSERPERVYLENDWYNEPRAGMADVFGKPRRFKSFFDEEEYQYLGSFLVLDLAGITLRH
jgi:hypothetical protein